jgi:misacylated tRNA(Ala) deacylase
VSLLFRDDAYLAISAATVTSVDERGIRLNRTVFYPTGGGQPGDRGTLVWADGGTTPIIDTVKGEGVDEVIHVPAPGSVLPAVGASVTAALDWAYRHRLMRMHTCLHLLCAVVPGSVTGGQVSDGKGRLDFDVPGEMLDKTAITERVNQLIREAHPVRQRWISDAELEARPELVRTMSVRPPTGRGSVRLLEIEDVDLQPCGGTHVANTSEIGSITVTKIENKGRQNRRVVVAFTA